MIEPLTERTLAAISVLHTGEWEGARRLFATLLHELAESDHFHRCVLAHYMADAQDDPAAELAWDVMALQEAEVAPAAQFDERFPGMTRASFFPSLHLNLAASCEKVGDLARAGEHARRAHAALALLPDTPLGQLTRDAIGRLRDRLRERAGIRE